MNFIYILLEDIGLNYSNILEVFDSKEKAERELCSRGYVKREDSSWERESDIQSTIWIYKRRVF